MNEDIKAKVHGLTIPTNALKYALDFFGKKTLPEFIETAKDEESWLFNELSKANNSGAEYGYSLAEQEIERLKGLIEKQFLQNLRGWGNEDQRAQVLQEFKTENNL